MKFVDNEHRKFFESIVQKTGAADDNNRQAMFYVLGMLPDTRRRINELYDFEKNSYKLDALKKPWQTSGSLRATRMAFNLYNGFDGRVGSRKIDDPAKYTPFRLFDYNNADYFLEAIRLLTGVYRNQMLALASDKDTSLKPKLSVARTDLER